MLRGLFRATGRRRYEEGIAHFNAGDDVAALRCFDAVLESGRDDRDPDRTLARFYRAQAHARLGRRALDEGRFAQAREHLESALEDQSGYPDLHSDRAWALLELEDPLAAERGARDALALHEQFVEAGALRVVALRELGDKHRAEEERRKWAARAAQTGHDWAPALAREDFDRQGLRRARAERRRAQRERERAEHLLAQGLHSAALEAYRNLVEAHPDYPDLRLRVARCELGRGELEAAERELGEALRLHPGFAEARLLAAEVALRRGCIGRCRHWLRVPEPLAPSSAHRLLTAFVAVSLAEFDRARREIAALEQTVIAGEEGLPPFLLATDALLHLVGGQPAVALERARRLAEATIPVTAWIDVLVVGSRLGDLALVDRAAASLRGEGVSAEAAYACAWALDHRGERDAALDTLAVHARAHPSDPALQALRAELLDARGEEEAALELCLAESGRSARLLMLGAHLLRRRGDLEEARRLLDEASQAWSVEPEGLEVERVAVLRLLDEATAADARVARHRALDPLDPRWRLLDRSRWLEPLRPMPLAPLGGDDRPVSSALA